VVVIARSYQGIGAGSAAVGAYVSAAVGGQGRNDVSRPLV
jgi:hypothetical protein